MSETTSPNSAPSPAPNTGKWQRRALIVSLAVNLLVIGAVVSAAIMWKHHRHHFRHGRGQDFGMFALMHHVPRERRRELHDELHKVRDTLRPYFRDIHKARKEAAQVLKKEPFDKDALRAAADSVTTKERALRAAAIEAFLNQAEKLSHEEREILAKMWEKRGHRKRWWKRKSHHHGDKKSDEK